MTTEKNIHTALAKAYSETGYVRKEGNDALKYTFASERAFIEHLRPALLAAGVYVHVHELADVGRELITTKNGHAYRTTLRATVRFTHAESGTYIDVQALGEGMDVGDKSQNKAMTIALKYALRQTMLIETGDDPDAHPSEPYEAPAPAKPAREPWPWEPLFRETKKRHGITGPEISEALGGTPPSITAIQVHLQESGETIEDLLDRIINARGSKKSGDPAP